MESAPHPSPTLPPTSRPPPSPPAAPPPLTPTVNAAKPAKFFAVGTVSRLSRDRRFSERVLATSTTGLAPETVMVSSSDPTFIDAFTFAVKPVVSSMSSRLYVLKPGSAKVTMYLPGRSSTISYRPWLSVVTARLCSIRAGLVAVTVTPGSTAPVLSVACPAIAVRADCDQTGDAVRTATTRALHKQLDTARMGQLLSVAPCSAKPQPHEENRRRRDRYRRESDGRF